MWGGKIVFLIPQRHGVPSSYLTTLIRFCSSIIKFAVLNDNDIDVKRMYFNAAPYSTNDFGDRASILGITSDAMLAIDLLTCILSPATAAAKMGMALSFATFATGALSFSIAAGAQDLIESHKIPLEWDNLDTMKVAKNSFSPIGNRALLIAHSLPHGRLPLRASRQNACILT